MDAAELKIICDNYEKRLDALRAELVTAEGELSLEITYGNCRRRGEHKYTERGPEGAKCKICIYCGHTAFA